MGKRSGGAWRWRTFDREWRVARRPRTAIIAAVTAIALGCASHDGSEGQPRESVGTATSALTATCSAHTVQIVDLRADFRDIWAGRETAASGKQADPDLRASLDFNTTVDPTRLGAQFVPSTLVGGAACAAATTVAATPLASVTPAAVWGSVTSDSGRPTNPFPYNAFVAASASGLPSVAGALAAGGDVTLSNFSLDGTVRQPVGLIAGGKVTLANGSIGGAVTFGATSTIPQSVSVAGTKTQQSFDVSAAFRDLQTLSTLLGEESPNGTVTTSGSTLVLRGTSQGRNLFRLTASALAQASSLQITVPSSAGAVITVTGANVTLQNKGITLSGATASTLLWNMPGAGSLVIGGVSLAGSVLAPSADAAFGSGSVTGTLVLRSLAMPGSGTLLSAPLNTSLLLPASAPSSVVLRPAQPLVPGCAYQLVIPTTQPLTASNNCLAVPFAVTFRVAKAPSTPAGRELEAATSDPSTGTLRRFSAKNGINTLVDDVFARYAQGFGGLPAARFTPLGAGVPSPTRPGHSIVGYQQYHQGYPVFGYGYTVTATSDNLFRDATGKVMPVLPDAPAAPITQAAAQSAVLSFLKITTPPWVTSPSKFHPPTAMLGWMAKRPDPTASDFLLVWHFQFAGTGLKEPATVQVDASTAKVVGSTAALEPVTGLANSAVFQLEDASGSVTTPADGRQTIPVAVYQQSGQTVTTLMTTDQNKPAGSLSVLYVNPNTNAAIVAVNPNSAWTATTGRQEQAMATAYWGLLRANSFLGTLGLTFTSGTPWRNVDGLGRQQVVILWNGDNPSTQTGYLASSDADTAEIQFDNDTDRTTAPHEFSHALLASIRRSLLVTPDLANRGESGSVSEGIADLYAIGTIHQQTPAPVPADWACVLDGTCNGAAARDLANPGHHTNPNYYKGANYGAYTDVTKCPDSDLCFRHQNATIVGYWGYLLGVGSKASPATNPCGLSVEPLDQDPDKALRMVLTIAYHAAGDHLGFLGMLAEPTFADFRDATISVARDLALQGQLPSNAPHKVELAWYAVGLGPEFLGDSTAPVAPPPSPETAVPADDDTGVEPWQLFGWSTSGHTDGLTSIDWDFQIADGPFDTSVKQELDGIRMVRADNGEVQEGPFLALPLNSTKRFYWRVRPHTTATWQSCFPVHSFVGTDGPSGVSGLDVTHNKAENGTIVPGEATLEWLGAHNAAAYHFGVTTQDASGCGFTNDVFDATMKEIGRGGPFHELAFLEKLQPSHHYFVNVQPIGPKDFAGQPSPGDCFRLAIETSSLPAATLRRPEPAAIELPSDKNPVFSWDVPSETESSTLLLYERDENGTCAQAPAFSQSIATPCHVPEYLATCPASFDSTPLPLANPTGYCWTVKVVAAGGESTTAANEWIGMVARAELVGPGIQAGLSDQGNPAPLPGDSYGSDVTFDFDAVPHALEYMVRLWKWEKDALPFPVVTIDPPNCASGKLESICSRPKHVVAEKITTTPSLVLDQGLASQDRYCWTVWPLLEDLKNPGSLGLRQPQVVLFPDFCYTAGPSEPVIVVDNPPPATGFSSKPITGHVHYDYIPDLQADVVANSDDVAFGTGCTADQGYVFSDIHNCDLPFTITPQPDQTYEIKALRWNSSAHPPVMDDTTKLPDVTKTLMTGHCGGKGDPCCDDNACNDDLGCNGGVCGPCGGIGQGCCQGNTCKGGTQSEPVSCESGICRRCGEAGAACCPGNSCFRTDPGDCKNGKCVSCGHVGEACCGDNFHPPMCPTLPAIASCVGNSCLKCGHPGQDCCPSHPNEGPANSLCDVFANCTGTKCVACGAKGQPCCTGNQAACGEPGTTCQGGMCAGTSGGGPDQCNEVLHEGGTAPETHVIDLHKSSGSFTFTFNTFDIPDRIVVTNQGQVLFDTTCVSTLAQPVGCQLFGVCCDANGVCTVQLNYSGGSQATVTVQPDCSGNGTTQWQFSVGCP